MRQWISNIFENYTGYYLPKISVIDVLEIIILTYLIYHLILWVKNTKAWMLIRGIIVIGAFIVVAFILQMNTILFIAKNMLTVLATAAIVVFQPELRRALEKLGERKFLSSIVNFEVSKETARFSEKTMNGMVDAAFEMGKVKTGALIVVEQAIHLTEYEQTGIDLDCIVSKQVLINIFEHNTPLHDGAIIVRGDRVVAATCYLPLSDNSSLSKELGTRHRAAVGLTEVSDALVIVVSEETGAVSVAREGQLKRNITKEELRAELLEIQDRKKSDESLLSFVLKGRRKDERKADE